MLLSSVVLPLPRNPVMTCSTAGARAGRGGQLGAVPRMVSAHVGTHRHGNPVIDYGAFHVDGVADVLGRCAGAHLAFSGGTRECGARKHCRRPRVIFKSNIVGADQARCPWLRGIGSGACDAMHGARSDETHPRFLSIVIKSARVYVSAKLTRARRSEAALVSVTTSFVERGPLCSLC